MENPERVTEEIGKRIAELRRKAGLTQSEFADLLGSSVQWVSLIERGRQNLTVHSLVNLANSLEVPTIDLLRPARSAGPKPGGRGRPRKPG